MFECRLHLDKWLILSYFETLMDKNITFFMEKALEEAKKAIPEEEVPVGALIVKGDKIISQAHNQRESKNNPCGHAEILAIQKASEKLQSWRLENCSLYVSLEPCLMCAGAILQARISHLFYACPDLKTGFSSFYELDKHKNWNKKLLEIHFLPYFEKQSSQLLKDFFQKLR